MFVNCLHQGYGNIEKAYIATQGKDVIVRIYKYLPYL